MRSLQDFYNDTFHIITCHVPITVTNDSHLLIVKAELTSYQIKTEYSISFYERTPPGNLQTIASIGTYGYDSALVNFREALVAKFPKESDETDFAI